MPKIYTMIALLRVQHAFSLTLKQYLSQSKILLIIFLLINSLIGCASLSYITSIYEQDPMPQIDVFIRVKDDKDLALTDLALNDFYVHHNGQPLERKNELRLNETLSAVKLYMVILVDQRENSELKNSFERTRKALKAYLTLQSSNMYIKLISYDTEARVLNEEFSNDRIALQRLLQELNMTQITKESGLKQALVLAQESIESLPNGAYALDPQMFSAEVTGSATESPLYNSAVLLMNHNRVGSEVLKPYYEQYNFLVLDSTGDLSELTRTNGLARVRDNNSDGVKTIFGIYELPPGDLNKDVDQTKAVKLVNQVWDSLNNIVNGYYWLTYNKYTDMSKPGPNIVTVSLTQYGRSKDEGLLMAYGAAAAGLDLAVLEVDIAAQNFNIPVLESDAATTGAFFAPIDLLPPAITEPRTYGLLALLPGQHSVQKELQEDPLLAVRVEPNLTLAYPENTRVVNEDFVIDDFEILSNLTPDSYLVSDKESTVPKYTAEPIQLVSGSSTPEVFDPAISTAPENITNGRYIQVGAFIKLANLYDVIERLSEDYNVRAVTSMVNGREYNRCIIGPFDSKKETLNALQQLKMQGSLYDAFIIQRPIAQWISK